MLDRILKYRFRIIVLLELVVGLSAYAADPLPVLQRRQISPAFEYQGGAIPTLILDADGNVRISTGKEYAPFHPGEVMILPNAPEKTLEWTLEKYFIVVISNQKNVVKLTSPTRVTESMQETIRLLESKGGKIHYFDFSENEAEDKPNSTMADRLESAFQQKWGRAAVIDRKRSFMVGDAAYASSDERPDGSAGTDHANFDRRFANQINVTFVEPQIFFGWETRGVMRFKTPQQVYAYQHLPIIKPCRFRLPKIAW